MHQMVYVKHEVYMPLMQTACPAESQDHTFYLSTLIGKRFHLGIHYLTEMFVLRPICCLSLQKKLHCSYLFSNAVEQSVESSDFTKH